MKILLPMIAISAISIIWSIVICLETGVITETDITIVAVYASIGCAIIITVGTFAWMFFLSITKNRTLKDLQARKELRDCGLDVRREEHWRAQ